MLKSFILRVIIFLSSAVIFGGTGFSETRAINETPGTVAGFFNVGSDGAAQYSVPIRIPPGTRGLQPKLSLSYNSRKGNGLLGVGWSVKGLRVISRCSKASPRKTQKSDFVFCLDDQRLIKLKGEYDSHKTEYGTKIDNGSRIFSHGMCGEGPCYFTLHNPNGDRSDFGRSEDSHLECPDSDDACAWALNQTTDRNGNYLRIIYSEDQGDGQHYPREIIYTGNKNGGLFPQHSIRFFYENRDDIISPYIDAFKITKRLTRILSKAGENLVKKYRFAYEYSPATLRSRLVSVRECDDIDNCLPPTILEWENGVLAFEQKKTNLDPSISDKNLENLPRRMIDINGDGLPDYVYGQPGIGAYWVALNEDNSFDLAKIRKLTGNFDAVKSIVNGLGGRIAIHYQDLSANRVHSENSSLAPPQTTYPSPLYVASQHTLDDGLGNIYALEHGYSGWTFDYYGDFAGFAETSVVEKAANRETANSYSRNFPYSGLLKQTIVRTLDKIPLTRSSYFYKSKKNESDIHRVSLVAEESEESSRGKTSRTRRFEYQYDSAQRLTFQFDSQGKEEDGAVCVYYSYEDHSGDAWWKSRFATAQKLADSLEGCRSPDFETWKPGNDISWRRFFYDSEMNLVGRKSWDDGKNKWIETKFAYDAYGNLVQKTDHQGRALVITYDDKYHAFPVEKRIGEFSINLEHEIRFGFKIRETDFNGNATTWIPPIKIDGFGRVLEVRANRPEGKTSAIIRKTIISAGENNKGLKTTVYRRSSWEKDNLDDWLWESEYRDALDRVYKIENKADGDRVIVRQKKLDRRGCVVKKRAPYYRPESRPFFDEFVRETGFISQSEPCRLKERENRSFLDEPPPVSVIEPGVGFADLTERASSNLEDYFSYFERPVGEPPGDSWSGAANSFFTFIESVSKTKQDNVETRRNSLGQVIAIVKDDSQIYSLNYTDSGYIKNVVDAKGQIVDFEYDALGRVVGKRLFSTGAYPDKPHKKFSYTYDRDAYAQGKLSSASSPEAAINFYYDHLGWIQSVKTSIYELDIGERDFVTEYRRDPLGRPLEIVYPDHSTVGILYDAGGKIYKIQLKEAGEDGFHDCLTYNRRAASGDIESLSYGNGLNFINMYESPGRLKSGSVFNNGEKLLELEYRWNTFGDPLSVIDRAGAAPYCLSRGFKYDSDGRLRSAVGSYFSGTYEYDSSGNIVGKTNFPKSFPIQAGFLGKGLAVNDAAVGFGYIMRSQEVVHKRFAAHPPHPHNADHFIVVFYQNGEWQYSDNSDRFYSFVPRPADILVAGFDFESKVLSDLKGQSSFLNGVAYGYADGDLIFHYDRWDNEPNKGEFFLTGNFITPNIAVFEAAPSSSCAVSPDYVSGLGYLMYSRKNVRERFLSHPPASENADHVVAVIYRDGQWKYNDGLYWRNFVPDEGDTLIAEVDFDIHGFADLKGKNGDFGGIAYGYSNGDFIFSSSLRSGDSKEKMFCLSGSGTFGNNRVADAIRDGLDEQNIKYDANGNIATKGDFRYFYNIEGRLSRVEKKVGADFKTAREFVYGPLGNRLAEITTDGSKTFYPSSSYKAVSSPKDGKKYIKYIAGSLAIGARKNEKAQTRYFYQRFRDGVVIVADEKGQLVNALIYEPYGKIIRLGATENNFRQEFSLVGYDPEIGLFCRGGLCYDPEIGGFLNFPVPAPKRYGDLNLKNSR